MTQAPAALPSSEVASLTYVVGIDVGSEQWSMCVMRPDKSLVIKPLDFANAQPGYIWLKAKLSHRDAEAHQVLVGLEATGRYWENLYHFLLSQGYRIHLLHPTQTHHYAQQRQLRAKTDQLDATTIARLLLSDDVRPAYVPDELITTYRELVRLHTTLSDEATRSTNAIRGIFVVLFPEFTQVFADPTRQTALALLQKYPGAHAILEAGVAGLTTFFQDKAPHRYGRKAAEQLVHRASTPAASGVACTARAKSLTILCDQRAHTLSNLKKLEHEWTARVESDTRMTSLRTVDEFGTKAVAVIRAAWGDIKRFKHSDQVVAYVGLDLTVKQSGKWKGHTKLSKQGSGLLRRLLYMAALNCLRLKSSAFKEYYYALVARGLKGRKALMAVMRKMVVVAYKLLKSEETYDPAKVWAAPHRWMNTEMERNHHVTQN